MLKKTLILLLLLSVLSLAFAQGQIELEKKDNLRIISLAPNITEIVYALGSSDQLVGRTDYCNYPEDVLSVPSIGTLWEPNLETILSLEPDIVIASSIVSPDVLASIEKAGIKAIQILKESSLQGTYELIEATGEAIGKANEAQILVNDLKQTIKKVSETVSQIDESKRKSVAYIIAWGAYGDYSATGDTYLNDVIEASGAINCAEAGTAWSFSKESLLAEDPDVILLPYYSYSDAQADVAAFCSTEPYSRLKAEIISVNGDAAERQGVRTAQIIQDFAKVIYPELFSE